MSANIISLSDRRPPVLYTVRIAHHWDGTLEVFVEDVQDDPRSRAAVSEALKNAAEAFGEQPSARQGGGGEGR